VGFVTDDDIESDDIDGEEDSSSESEAASSQDEDTESQVFAHSPDSALDPWPTEQRDAYKR